MKNTAVRKSKSYLLRMWAEDDIEQFVWRISVIPIEQTTDKHQPVGFPSLDILIQYLQNELQQLV